MPSSSDISYKDSIGDLDSELNEIGIPEDVRKVIISQLYGAY